jgi:hypothetical protein
MPHTRPLFLARQTYRLRRLMDAARLLPVLGFFLFLFPILWGPGTSVAHSTVFDGLYLFLVWPGLILCAFLISRALAPAAEDAEAAEEEDK